MAGDAAHPVAAVAREARAHAHVERALRAVLPVSRHPDCEHLHELNVANGQGRVREAGPRVAGVLVVERGIQRGGERDNPLPVDLQRDVLRARRCRGGVLRQRVLVV